MIARLDRILHKLANQHGVTLPPDTPGENPFHTLDRRARHLAKEANVLVLVGNLPRELWNMRDFYVNDWVNGYAQLYRLLADNLFPDWNTLKANDADPQNPPVAIIEGEATPLFPVFYDTIVPYLEERQPYRQIIKDFEIRGFLDNVLRDQLMAGDLNPQLYNGLLTSGVELVRQMLNAPIGHIRIKTLKLPKTDPPPPPPPGLPGTDRLRPPKTQSKPQQQQHDLPVIEEEDSQPITPTEQMFLDIPIWRSDSKRTPPVPPVPGIDDYDDDDKKNGRR